jgi:hypothetical protein
MADRVFPNNTNVDMGSKISFSGIDWSSVEQNIQKNKYASSQDEQIAHLLKMAEMMDNEKNAEDCEAEEMHDKKAETKEEEHEEEGKKELEHRDPKHTLASDSNKMKKIAFTHPSQISAEAIEAAEAAGDTKLVNTILAARKANRQRIASAIETKMTKEAGLAKRQAQREAIIKMAQNMETAVPQSQLDSMSVTDMEQLVDSFKGNAPEYFTKALEEKKNKSNSSLDVMAFTSPAKFSTAQRNAFNKVALSLGMPKEYVDSMCTPSYSQEVLSLANEIKGVFASNVSSKTKQALTKSLIKEAKLSPDSKSEFIDYWNNVLGYQDKDFWPMVASDYDDGKKVN